jgi:hypothetical protein
VGGGRKKSMLAWEESKMVYPDTETIKRLENR